MVDNFVGDSHPRHLETGILCEIVYPSRINSYAFYSRTPLWPIYGSMGCKRGYLLWPVHYAFCYFSRSFCVCTRDNSPPDWQLWFLEKCSRGVGKLIDTSLCSWIDVMTYSYKALAKRTYKLMQVLDLRSTCVSFDHQLVWTCVNFGRAQIWTQVDASFLPFGHPVQVNTSWSQVICCYKSH